MKLYKQLLSVTSASLLLFGTSLLAQEQSPRDVMHNAFKYLHGMDQYAFKAVVIDNEKAEDGSTEEYRFDTSVKVDRPDKFQINVKSASKDRSNYLHNGVYTMMDHQFNYYGQIKASDTIDGTLDYLFEEYGIRSPLAQLLYSEMQKRTKFTKSKNFGTVMVDGTECDYVAFSDGARDIHIWVETGDKPLIKAYSIIDRMSEDDYRINTSLVWDIDAKISDSDFIFKAPKGAEKISVQSPY
jgi:hypothetical protein